jgi:hypothetical protein
MLRLVMITFNDAGFVQRCIESAPWVDEVVAVDGRYIDYPLGPMQSNDGTLEYLESVDKVNLILRPGLTEIDKRNEYLVGEPGDWYLHLDADEEWVGPAPVIDPEVDAYVIDFHRPRPIRKMDRVRLFKHVEGLHYEGKHYWLRDSAGVTFALLQQVGKAYRGARIEGAYIDHHELERSAERQRDRKIYYNILSRRENQIEEVL